MDDKKPVKKKLSADDNKKNKQFVKNTIDLKPKLDDGINEAKSDTVVFAWGRMNPPTIGHEKLVEKVKQVAKQNSAAPRIYLSQSYDSKSNPLPYKTKIRLAKKAFGNVVIESKSKTIMQVMKEMENAGYKRVTLVAGSDRINEFKTLLNKYNGRDYKFESIDIISAGQRDPDAEGAEGMSGTKMRNLAADNNLNEFKKGLPRKLQSMAEKVLQNVRDGMEIAEQMEYEGFDLNEAVLTVAQRRKRAIAFRRAKARILRGRKIAQRKMAPKEKLEKRSRRAAIRLIRRRVAGKKGQRYKSLSPAEKMSVDKLVAKRTAAISRIAKRLMPKVRQAERERLRSFQKSKSISKEEFDNALNIIMEAYFKVDIEGLPKFFMDANSPSEIKVDLRRLLKKPGEVVNSIERVQKSAIIKAFRLQAQGKSDDGGSIGVDEQFENFITEKMSVQDPDIKDKKGSQPKRFHTGLSKSTKEKRDSHFKRQEKMADNDPNAYKAAPGDDKKTQTSKFTKKYHQMFGKEQNMKFDKRFRFNKKVEMTEEEYCDYIDEMFDVFEAIELEEKSLEGLKKKAEKSGIPYGILKKVYDRGLAAWKIGHRPGANQQQWAYARVNSFITKGKGTWGKADADLAAKVRSESVELDEAIKPHSDVIRAYNKIADAESMAADWNYGGSKGRVSRARTHLSKMIRKHHPEFDKLDDQEKVNFFTLVQKKAFKEEVNLEACWPGYKQVGVKKKGKKMVPNCVPENKGVGESALDRLKNFDKSRQAAGKKPIFTNDKPTKYVKMKKPGSITTMNVPGHQVDKYKKDGWSEETSQVDITREKIKKEKETDKKKHDRMMDRARTTDTRAANMAINEGFVPAGISDTMFANEFEEHKVHGGFALHPSVTEEGGAGEWGTKKLIKKYKKDTPGEIPEAIQFMENHNIDFCENIYRPMSEKYFEFFREARRLYEEGEIDVNGVNKQLLETDIGEFAYYEDTEVPLDCPLIEEDQPELNKPKRGGKKKFYVYVKDPSTGNIKKVSWGDTTGLKAKINDPAARKSFAARHKCDTRNDKTKASYWACRLPRYAKMLGMQANNPGSWW